MIWKYAIFGFLFLFLICCSFLLKLYLLDREILQFSCLDDMLKHYIYMKIHKHERVYLI